METFLEFINESKLSPNFILFDKKREKFRSKWWHKAIENLLKCTVIKGKDNKLWRSKVGKRIISFHNLLKLDMKLFCFRHFARKNVKLFRAFSDNFCLITDGSTRS